MIDHIAILTIDQIYMYEKEESQAKNVLTNFISTHPSYYRAYYYYAIFLREYYFNATNDRVIIYRRLLNFDPISLLALSDLLMMYYEGMAYFFLFGIIYLF